MDKKVYDRNSTPLAPNLSNTGVMLRFWPKKSLFWVIPRSPSNQFMFASTDLTSSFLEQKRT